MAVSAAALLGRIDEAERFLAEMDVASLPRRRVPVPAPRSPPASRAWATEFYADGPAEAIYPDSPAGETLTALADAAGAPAAAPAQPPSK